MNTTTIVSAAETEENELSILVEAAYTEHFLKFLKGKNANCSQPTSAIFRTGRVYVDANGRKQIEQETLVNEVTANGTMKDFEKWAAEWISTIPEGGI